MTPHELQEAASELFPETGRGTLAASLGVDASTVWRYLQRSSVPGPVAAAVGAWNRLYKQLGLYPPSKPSEMNDFIELVELAAPGLQKECGLSGFEAAAFLVFGEDWKRALCASLGIDASTLWRQISGKSISGPVSASMRAWLLMWRATGERPVAQEKSKLSKSKVPVYARLLLD